VSAYFEKMIDSMTADDLRHVVELLHLNHPTAIENIIARVTDTEPEALNEA
jgi:hypothetical protein